MSAVLIRVRDALMVHGARHLIVEGGGIAASVAMLGCAASVLMLSGPQ